MRNFYSKIFILLIVFWTNFVFSQSFTENFDNIATLTGSGWSQQNNSSPAGINPVWFQGNPPSAGGPFTAYNGADNSYIACNFNSTSGAGTISNWLLTPNRTFRNGDVLTFFTRKHDVGQDYPDRMEVRLSTNGSSTNVGSTATSTGDFTTLLLSINPSLIVGVYPRQWTQYTVTISGLPAPTSGRIAFRYFVTNGGPTGLNSDYIGLDNVIYTPYTCPAFTLTPGGAFTNGVAGTAYSKTLTQTGSLGSPTFAITAGALPAGLSLSAAGTISGTPTATGTFNFTVTVSDASGCSGSQSYSITVVCPPNPIAIADFPTLCSNGGLFTLSGATPVGGTYTGTGVSGGQFDPAAGTQTITYSYTDPYGCSFTLTKTITVSTAQSITSQPVSREICAGANTTFSVAANGATGYQWQVDTGSGFTNVSNVAPYSGATTSSLNLTNVNSSLNGSIYRVVILGASGCNAINSESKTLKVNSAPTISTQPSAQTVCSGGNVTFTAITSNATGYMWQVNQGVGFTTITNGGIYSGATTAALTISGATTGMSGFVYRLLVTGLCTPNAVSDNATLTVSAVTGSTVKTDVSCNGGSNGSINLTPAGGTAPYTFDWGGGIFTEDRTGLSVGTYTVNIKDANGCSGSTSVIITQPTALVATPSSTNVSCNSGSNGTASVSASGGTPGYTYLWNNGATTASITGLTAGNYSVTLTDAKGCNATQTFSITQPTALVATPSSTNVSCNSGSNGTASVSVSGGTPGYTYLWNNGATTASINGLTAGTYSVTITDNNGCTATQAFTITEPTALVATP